MNNLFSESYSYSASMIKSGIVVILTLLAGMNSSSADQTVFAQPTWVAQKAHTANGTFTKDYFGMHVIDPDGATEWPPQEGFGSVRLWDNNVTWAKLEPARGVWSFEALDRLVSAAELRKAKVLLVLGQTPGWASARPQEASPYAPGNAAEPRNIMDWRDYVRVVATRYKGRIESYEIWNEVNAKNFWTGTYSQMAELEREAAQIIKTVDPQAIVVSADLTNTNNRSTVDQFLEAGNGRFADVIAYHFYVQQSAPEEIVNAILMVEDAIAKHGLAGKPLWNTETGWLIPENDGSFSDTRASQQWRAWRHLKPGDGVAYVSRALVLARMLGVERFYWYGWDHGAFGLTSDRGRTKRFAAISYLSTVNWLVGAHFVGCDSSDNIWSCQLSRNNKVAWLVWTTSGQHLIPASLRLRAVSLQKLGSSQVQVKSDITIVNETPMLLLGQQGNW